MNEQNNQAEMLLDVIGQLPDEMVTGAAPTGNKKRNPVLWRRLGAAAACLVVTGGVVLGMMGGGLSDRTDQGDDPNRGNQELLPPGMMGAPEMGAQLPWDQYPIGQRYSSFAYDGRSYTTQAVVAKENLIGQALGEVTAVGYDWSNGDKKQTTKGTVYALTGVSTEFAVALRFETGETYVYADTSYRPATLGEMIDALALKELMRFGNVYTEGNGYVYQDVPDEVIWELMLSDCTLENVYDPNDLGTGVCGNPLVSASVYIEALGYYNISLQVTDTGYLCTNIGSTGKAFFIGTARAQQIADYIADNFEGQKFVYESDGNIGAPESGVVYPDEGSGYGESGAGGQSSAGSAGGAQTTPSYPR